MDAIRNPYVPNAGAMPPELVGRSDVIEEARVALGRVQTGRSAKSIVAVGLRGVGKTVLLNRLRSQAEEMGYRTTAIEAHENKRLAELLVPPIRRSLLELDRLGRLEEQVKFGLGVLRSFISAFKVTVGEAELTLDVEPQRGVADSGDLEADLPELFVSLGKAARSRKVSLAYFVDELQYLTTRDMSALIMALHRVVQEGLPIILIGAGLPQVVGLSGRSKSYSERLFNFPELGPLIDSDARAAIVEPASLDGITYTDDALDELVQVTSGYPYFIQEWAYQAWLTASASPITLQDVRAATPSVLKRLDAGFFRVRFDRLTPRERDYLRAMAQLGPGPHRSGEVADVLRVPVTSIGPLRKGLFNKGMAFSPAHGDIAFTVPLFDQFLHRIMPDWTPNRR